jgi:type II secretion system protein G
MKHQRGFTLLEMMVVVAIIAILAAILIPNFTHARAQAATSACMSNLKSIATAMELYYTDNQYYPTANDADIATLGLSKYMGNQKPIDPAAAGTTGVYKVTSKETSGVCSYEIWCPGTHDPSTLSAIANGNTTNTTIEYDNAQGMKTSSGQGVP